MATATSQQKAKLLKSNHQYVADDKLDTVVDDVAGPDGNFETRNLVPKIVS